MNIKQFKQLNDEQQTINNEQPLNNEQRIMSSEP